MLSSLSLSLSCLLSLSLSLVLSTLLAPCPDTAQCSRNARASSLTSLSLVYGRFMAAWAVTGMSTTLPKGMPARKAPNFSASQHPHTLASPSGRLGVPHC